MLSDNLSTVRSCHEQAEQVGANGKSTHSRSAQAGNSTCFQLASVQSKWWIEMPLSEAWENNRNQTSWQ